MMAQQSPQVCYLQARQVFLNQGHSIATIHFSEIWLNGFHGSYSDQIAKVVIAKNHDMWKYSGKCPQN